MGKVVHYIWKRAKPILAFAKTAEFLHMGVIMHGVPFMLGSEYRDYQAGTLPQGVSAL